MRGAVCTNLQISDNLDKFQREFLFCSMSHPTRQRHISPTSHGLHAKDGFTLIELLVVIAIIAILAGLGFAGMKGAMDSSKKAQARNDVHQLAAAVKAFQLEYGRLPITGTGSADNTNANNALIIAALTTNNPRGLVFFEPKQASKGKGGLDRGVYMDPWGKPYTFMLDTSYDNKIVANSVTNFTTVIVSSTGGSTNTNDATKVITNLK
jgi:prepilin-type N-terminal cleavage/methylation domain-containing protein